MATLYTALCALFIYQQVSSVVSVCLTGCSCTDETFGRSLLCMELPYVRIPPNIPENFIKIRIEKSHVTEIPQGVFSQISALMFLWLNFNDITLMNVRSLEGLHNLTELRIQDNKLRSIPWTAFQDTPELKVLDLKHNRIDVLPENALRHLLALTYLDLSFNQLTIVSRDVFLNWPRFYSQTRGRKEEQTNVVLALHDNRWLCDCRLRGFIEFINSVAPPIVLMSSYMTCSGPESRAGKFFHELELKTCLKPETFSPQTNITLPLGSNVTVRCLVKSRPEAVIRWSYRLKSIRGFTVSQTQLDVDTISSALIIPVLHAADRGVYTCTANNFIGNSSINIWLDVQSHNSSFPLSTAVYENVYIDVRIAKQTVYGVTVEWFTLTEKPAQTWFTVYFGRHDMPKKDAIYMSPGSNSYSVNGLLPLTKYEVCVTVRNHAPRDSQCVVFVTGSDTNERERRERLIHIIVIVCAMVLAVPAGMFVCTTNTRCRCCESCAELYDRRRRHEKDLRPGERHERQNTFDSLQAASDEKLCRDDKAQNGNSAQLY
ncbi:leucine-rich repeat, immunoglobulin-like domain and transmembrane domain-containing protein 2 [Xyrauchen texanus]|uniref:leucine-rich repeat, immunoglobulin-like domain and transmembrane domain-containing protein 2 n=1 Tax=Xyrauchen texanus TaxID=154827 RepID=UPI00224189A5|nr:leucine-rich repeat, immunoglobulin-like domain and transmembrane domain-containing protein 2 [Xyrauchen texanus]